jgi:5-methylcytosine-specific restriction endonuclease McrA
VDETQLLPASSHGKSTAYKKGCRCDLCVTANRERSMRTYLKRRDKVNAKRSVDYQENRVTILEQRATHYATNREQVLERVHKYREENRDEINDRRRSAYAENPEPVLLYWQQRRTRLKGNGVFTVTDRDWKRLCRRYDNRCFYCGSDGPLTMDHVIPISRGGRHSVGNLLPACKGCNSTKNNRTIMEWRLSDRTVAPAATYGRPNMGEKLGRQLASA